MPLHILWRGGAEAERLAALSTIQTNFTGDRRPSEWPPSLLDRAVALQDGSAEDARANLLYHSYHLDRGELEESEAYLENALVNVEQMPLEWQAYTFRAAAFYQAYCRRDASAAHEWREKIPKWEMYHPWLSDTLLLIDSAILLAEGQPEEARRKAVEGLNYAEESIFPGQARANREAFQAILAEVDRVAEAPPATVETPS